MRCSEHWDKLAHGGNLVPTSVRDHEKVTRKRPSSTGLKPRLCLGTKSGSHNYLCTTKYKTQRRGATSGKKRSVAFNHSVLLRSPTAIRKDCKNYPVKSHDHVNYLTYQRKYCGERKLPREEYAFRADKNCLEKYWMMNYEEAKAIYKKKTCPKSTIVITSVSGWPQKGSPQTSKYVRSSIAMTTKILTVGITDRYLSSRQKQSNIARVGIWCYNCGKKVN